MLCYYSVKGGAGCSVISAASALQQSRTQPTLLVDLNHDQPTLLGVEAQGPGLADWFASPHPPADALPRLEITVTDKLALLPTGGASIEGTQEQFRLLANLLRSDERFVVVDVGVSAREAIEILNASMRSVLVTRACYLALRRAQDGPPPDDVVLITEPGRALRAKDVQDALQARISAELPWDPAVARAVDAGLLQARMPRSLTKLDLST